MKQTFKSSMMVFDFVWWSMSLCWQALLEGALPLEGKVNLKKPDTLFGLMEDYGSTDNPHSPEEPHTIYFGRWVCLSYHPWFIYPTIFVYAPLSQPWDIFTQQLLERGSMITTKLSWYCWLRILFSPDNPSPSECPSVLPFLFSYHTTFFQY